VIQKLRKLVCIAVALGVVAVCGKVAMAAPTCPPLCLLPPDPAPPMPPINVPDPPFNPIAMPNPNSNHGGRTTATMAAGRLSGVMVVGKRQEGGECRSGKATGTLVRQNGKFVCNFMPSTLKVGGACHATEKIGTVSVVDGKRYCRIGP
jgi:hypothetical protein